MKKLLLTAVLLCLAFAAAVAEETSDLMTTVEGTIILERDGPSKKVCKIRIPDGSFIRLDIANGELLKLKLRESEKIRVRGIRIGRTSQSAEHILARVLWYQGSEITVEAPVQLTEDDRAHIVAEKPAATPEANQEQAQFQNWIQRQRYFHPEN